MTKRFTTIVPVYDWAVITVIITDDMKAAIIKRGGKYDNERGFFHREGKKHTIILDKKKLTCGTIAHEAYHAATQILWCSGVRIDRKTNDEPAAYLLDFLVMWILKKLRKANISVKSKA